MQAAISISIVTIGFIIYYFTIHSVLLHKHFVKKDGEKKAKSTWVIYQRLIGVLIFGVIPILIAFCLNIDLASIGLTFENKSPTLMWMIIFSLLCVSINILACKEPDHLEMYPQIRTPLPWSKGLLFTSAITLVLYTLAYEIMFRGFLLFSCEKEMDIISAIIINISIYSLVHIPKGWKETIGALPMGFALCAFTIKSGNIWFAVVVHSALALSSEWLSIYFHLKKSTI